MAKKPIQSLIAIVAVIAAGWWAFHSVSNPSLKFDLTPYHALGTGAAEEAMRLLGNRGEVLVFALDMREVKDPVIEDELKSFAQTLKKSGVKIAATTRFRLTPMERMGTGGAVPGAILVKAIQDRPSVGVVVLFCPFPQDFTPAKPGEPKFIVVSGYRPVYRTLLQTKVISAAIVPRFDRTSETTKKSKTLKEAFDEEFLVVTPENLSILPY